MIGGEGNIEKFDENQPVRESLTSISCRSGWVVGGIERIPVKRYFLVKWKIKHDCSAKYN